MAKNVDPRDAIGGDDQCLGDCDLGGEDSDDANAAFVDLRTLSYPVFMTASGNSQVKEFLLVNLGNASTGPIKYLQYGFSHNGKVMFEVYPEGALIDGNPLAELPALAPSQTGTYRLRIKFLADYMAAVAIPRGAEEMPIDRLSFYGTGGNGLPGWSMPLNDTANDPSKGMPLVSVINNSGGDDDEDGTVLCTALYQQGLLARDIWEADTSYGKVAVGAESLRNYHAWATPVSKLMLKSPILTRLLKPAISGWAHQMAYRMGVRENPDRVGAFLETYGVPVSDFIGTKVRAIKEASSIEEEAVSEPSKY